MKRLFPALLIPALVSLLLSCQHQPVVYNGQYPDAVANIMVNKCATAGCHNDKSYINAGGLRLDTWGHLMEGGANGSVVIPFSKGYSSLLFFINTDTNQGPVLTPGMPLNGASLHTAEYSVIRDWILAGAPDKTGHIPFESDPGGRQKVYISQQGCDQIAVVDAATNLIMRYIGIGVSSSIEVPHCVRFTADGRYAYVTFTAGEYLQQIDAATDRVVNSLYLGIGSWNLFQLSHDGTKMLACDYYGGVIKYVDLAHMQILDSFDGFANPHGIASTPNFDTFFVTAQFGNTVYRLVIKNGIGVSKELSIDDDEPGINPKYDPHEIIMAPDYSKYFLTCQTSNEVRVMDPHTNKLLKAIPVGTFPQEFALSHVKPYLFVSCEEEVTAEFPGYRGAVYVINYNTLELVARIPGPFFQIHGITVDDQRGLLYIASRNIRSDGPAPHHTSECGGRNGYYNVYDINTFQSHDGKRYESSVDPYSADIRFK